MKSFKLSGNRTASLALALAAAFALVPAVAAAQDQIPGPADNATSQPVPGTKNTTKSTVFNDLDANKDGKLSRDEVASDPRLSRDFDTLDTDRDGYLSKRELKAYGDHPVATEERRH